MKRMLSVVAAGLLSGIATPAAAKPLKVFILAGQSNMEGHAAVSTFDHIGMDPKTAPLLKDMRNADGTPRVCDNVDIAFFTSKGGSSKGPTPVYKQGKLTTDFGAQGRAPQIGPEFTFGIYMQKQLNEPILIIKTAWGGKSLNTDFRSPSAGPFQWNEQLAAEKSAEEKEKKKAATGQSYREMMEAVQKVLADPAKVCLAYNKKEGYELAGFVWFQGFNDYVASAVYPDRNKPGGYDLYSELLCHFIRDVRKDLNAPKMPFVIGVLGIDGPVTEESEARKPERTRGILPNFRKAMAAPAAMPEFKGNVAAVLTEKYWDSQLGELAARSEQVKSLSKKLAKEGKLSAEEQNAAVDKFSAGLFTPKEREILEKGKSNQAYHYLGSSKIMAQIGKAFADAMMELLKQPGEPGKGDAAAKAKSLAIVPVAGGAPKSREKTPIPDFTQGGKIPEGSLDVTHDWTLGATGARGWVYGWQSQTTEARQILVTQVDKDSPADGVLDTGDVILGINGQPFADDARIELAKALTTAEQEQNCGLLKLMRWRAGKSENVQLKLQVLGTYSHTAPYNCPKSVIIFERGCQAIAKKGLGGVSIPNDLNALALLASGKQEYRPMLADYAKKVAAFRAEQYATWLYGYANMFLAEYVLATHDTSVLEGVKRLALEAANGQSGVGTWGHKFARPDGNLNGYGCMNQPGLSLTLSLVLARQAGVHEQALDRAIAQSAGFLRWYVNKGGIPYGDHGPWPSHEDNGKCSSAAVLFDLLDDREATAFFARMGTAAYDERERGHTGNFFNVLWAMPGVSRCGPLATGAYLHEQSWYYDLARGWDGSFEYQGVPAGGQEHGKYTKWDCTGAYLLAYALPLKSLYLTGKKPSSVPALNAQEVETVIAAGRDLFTVNGKNGYDARTNEELLAGLASWSSAVRHRSAQALGRRQGDFVPTLTRLLAATDRDTRYGACEALGVLGPQADAAAPQLRALIKESDPWMQGLASKALMNLSAAVRNDSVNDLLAMMVRPNPADPRRMLQRDASVVLFARSPGVRDGPQSILADSLEGVDRQLLYPALQSALQNEDSIVRSAIGKSVYDKLTDRDLAILLPDIVKATEKLAPSDEMFGDGVRLAGLELLARLHIREGMPLCVSVMELDRWGSGKRVPGCMKILRTYGARAKEVLPQLREVNRNAGGGNKDIEKLIADIEASTEAPTLVSLKEFIARASASGDGSIHTKERK